MLGSVINLDCSRCGMSRQHSVRGIAYEDGGVFEIEPGKYEKNDDHENWLLQCATCECMSLWSMCPDGDKKFPAYCYYKELTYHRGFEYSKLKLDPKLASTITEREKEITLCLSNGSWLASIILMGSILEGILLAAMEKNLATVLACKAAPKTKDSSGKLIPKPTEKWKLGEMIDVASELKWLDKSIQQHCIVIREFRNLVHPRQYVKLDSININETSALIARLALTEALNQLQTQFK